MEEFLKETEYLDFNNSKIRSTVNDLVKNVNDNKEKAFVDISKHILDNIVDTRTEYVDHSYTEVFLDNKWIKVDSYVVDTQLFNNSMKKLSKENKILGYGIHKDATNIWDGEHDAFSQYVLADAKNISTKEYGVFGDVKEFYQKAPNTWNKANTIQNLVFILFSGAFSKKVEKIRNENL